MQSLRVGSRSAIELAKASFDSAVSLWYTTARCDLPPFALGRSDMSALTLILIDLYKCKGAPLQGDNDWHQQAAASQGLSAASWPADACYTLQAGACLAALAERLPTLGA